MRSPFDRIVDLVGLGREELGAEAGHAGKVRLLPALCLEAYDAWF